MKESSDAYMVLVGKPEGKRPLRKNKRRWVDNIKMDLREVGWGGIDWIDLALTSSCECGNEPSGCIKCTEFPD